MITHYGLFWSERDVFWGRRKNPGELRGRESQESMKSAGKDFRAYIGLYCLYGDNQLLYIGEAGLGTKSNLFSRLKQHRRGMMAGRWDHFSWFGRKDCKGETSTKDSLQQLEAITIAVINPGFNRQSGTFAKAKQVFQISHPESEGDLETKLSRIAEDISKLIEKK